MREGAGRRGYRGLVEKLSLCNEALKKGNQVGRCWHRFMSDKLPRITAAELLRALRRDGWYGVRQSGSHLTLRHPTKSGYVTVPSHAGVILKPKTLSSVLKQAGLTSDDLRKLL